MTESDAVLARVVRDHAGRLAASLVGVIGDFGAAEDLVADAVETALRRWPVEGIPERPDAWLFTVARRRGLDVLRRRENLRRKLADVEWRPPPRRDDRLRLIFTCCHPALPREAQIALTLRVVCGLTTAQIAAAFLASEAAVSRRITRAKRKIADAGISYRVPRPDELDARLGEVLAVLYLMFNEGYLSSSTERVQVRDLADDAAWLTALLAGLMRTEPEVLGLQALIGFHRARTAGRFDVDGGLIPLGDQDRSLWDREGIEAAETILVRAASHKRPGPYQLQAAIVACHAEAGDWASTDWDQIVVLYDMLLVYWPTPLVRLQRAIAVAHHEGPRTGLDALDALGDDLDDHHLFHAARAEMLRALGDPTGAHEADQRALQLTANPAQVALLSARLKWN